MRFSPPSNKKIFPRPVFGLQSQACALETMPTMCNTAQPYQFQTIHLLSVTLVPYFNPVVLRTNGVLAVLNAIGVRLLMSPNSSYFLVEDCRTTYSICKGRKSI